MTFGTCQVSDARVLSIPMETIRKEPLRWTIPLYWIGLAGMVGLGFFFIHHPTDCAMRVCLAYLAVLVTISQILSWDLKWTADPGACSPHQEGV
jgi:hypothetical protein